MTPRVALVAAGAYLLLAAVFTVQALEAALGGSVLLFGWSVLWVALCLWAAATLRRVAEDDGRQPAKSRRSL